MVVRARDRRAITFVAALTFVLALVAFASYDAAATVNYSSNPSADATLKSGFPNVNYGTGTTLDLKAGTTQVTQKPILRFTVGALDGNIVSATLKLYTLDAWDASKIITVEPIAPGGWDETTVTWANGPNYNYQGWLQSSSGAQSANSWVSLDVTPYVTGAGTWEMGLSTNSTALLNFNSREASSNKPELDITTDGPTTTTVPATTTTAGPTSTTTTTWTTSDPSFDQPSPSNPDDFKQHVDFDVRCAYGTQHLTHINNDDPIKYPGQQGVSHTHVFAGNNTTDYASSYQSLQAGSTACELDRDTAAYWQPRLYAADGTPLTPYHVRAYYRRGTMNQTSHIPAGLKIIAGNAAATSPQDFHIAGWQCRSVSPDVQTVPKQATIPTCASSDILEGSVVFPNCWDGINLDSTDHKSHMAYSDGTTQDNCPQGFPVQIPQLTIGYRYAAGTTNSSAYLASDAMLGETGGITLHADFWNAWDQPTLDVLTERCINMGYHCGDVSPSHFPGAMP